LKRTTIPGEKQKSVLEAGGGALSTASIKAKEKREESKLRGEEKLFSSVQGTHGSLKTMLQKPEPEGDLREKE